MYATDVRQTDVRQKHSLTPPPIRGWGITMCKIHASRSQQRHNEYNMFESYFSLLKRAELSKTEKLPHKVPMQQNLNGRFLTSMHMNKLTLFLTDN